MPNKYFILSFFSAMLFTFPAKAQDTLNVKQDTLTVKKEYHYRKNEFFFLISLNYPKGSFGEDFDIDPNATLEEQFANTMEGRTGGFGAQKTTGIELGGFFYLTKKPKPVCYGLKITFFSFAGFPFKWTSDGDYIYNNAVYDHMNFISVKVGPSIRFLMMHDLAVRFSYQLVPTMSYNGQWAYEARDTFFYSNKYLIYIDRGDMQFNRGYGLKQEFSLNLNYRFITAGVSYNFGKVSYDNVHFHRSKQNTNDNYYFQNVSSLLSGKTSVNLFMINFGVMLGRRTVKPKPAG